MLAWDEIDTVLLDMDGTLLDLHFDNHFVITSYSIHYTKLYELKIASKDSE